MPRPGIGDSRAPLRLGVRLSIPEHSAFPGYSRNPLEICSSACRGLWAGLRTPPDRLNRATDSCRIVPGDSVIDQATERISACSNRCNRDLMLMAVAPP